ncbi:hypothetical protein K9L67_02725 [Candidatus Woesearchaeota archaeon]|nr:hypothetical protein [Candidatus Woesearchaeota archaeon]MCF7901117.1 hypothetical protein [Candidatus Woesearchaeota archaeon]MCF8012894.1 hypothetical protein [Candidatus Woesearchaeota archaeon]
MTIEKQFEEEMNGFFVSIIKGFGFDMLTSKLFSMLFIEPGEISMDDLAERTGYALSGISSKLKMLEGIGFIRKIKKPGSKKLYFIMDSDIKAIMRNKMQKGIEIEINPVKHKIPHILDKYKKQYELSKNDRFKKQYDIVRFYYKQIMQLEKILQKTMEEMEKLM